VVVNLADKVYHLGMHNSQRISMAKYQCFRMELVDSL